MLYAARRRLTRHTYRGESLGLPLVPSVSLFLPNNRTTDRRDRARIILNVIARMPTRRCSTNVCGLEFDPVGGVPLLSGSRPVHDRESRRGRTARL